MDIQEFLENIPLPIPIELNTFIKKWSLDELGFVYERTLGNMHVFYLQTGYRLWLVTDVNGFGRVSVGEIPSLLTLPTFKSRHKMLRLLVELGCPQAVTMQRTLKINKLL